MDQRKAPGAVASLVLGILGIAVCGILAPFAWHYGQKAEALAATGDYGGQGIPTAGKVLGIIGTVILIVGLVAALILVATGNNAIE